VLQVLMFLCIHAHECDCLHRVEGIACMTCLSNTFNLHDQSLFASGHSNSHVLRLVLIV
jgi:hypothetical protein